MSPLDNRPTHRDFFLPDLCNAQALLVLVVLAELLALLVSALQRGLLPFDWTFFSLASLFCLLVFLSTAALLCPLRHWFATLPLIAASSLIYGSVLLLVGAYTLGGQWLLGLGTVQGPRFDHNTLLLNLVVAALVAGIGLRYLYLSWQLRLRQQSEMSARVEALQSRIRPHFLFNSLNTIASLIDEDSHKAERAVEDLAALFRANLQDGAAISHWRQERELCERYLRIEAARLGERLRVSWACDDVDDNTPILSLSLQPLVENAISHGIQQLPEGGEIQISASQRNGRCQVSVRNPLPEGTDRHQGNHLACDNLRHRLQALYGDEGKLTLQQDSGHFEVTLEFPVASAGESD